MEIKRKIYKKIVEWKEKSNGSKALLIEGARRIGKSTVVEEIGKNEYKSYILIDFNRVNKKTKDAFDDLNNLDLFFFLSPYYTSRYTQDNNITNNPLCAR